MSISKTAIVIVFEGRMINAVVTWSFQLLALGVLIPTTYYLFDYLSGDIFHQEILCHRDHGGHSKCLAHDEMSFAWKLLPPLSLAAWHIQAVKDVRRKLFDFDLEHIHGPVSLVVSCLLIHYIIFNNQFPGINLWMIDSEFETLQWILMFLHGIVWLWIVLSALGFFLSGMGSKDVPSPSHNLPEFSVFVLMSILFWTSPCMSYDRFVDATLFTIFSLFFMSRS